MLSAAVLVGFAVAALAPFATPHLGARAGWVWATLPAALATWFAAQVPQVRSGAPLEQAIPWLPSLGIDLAFRLDGLSLVFALMITVIGTAVVIYAGGYLRGDRQLPRFYLLLLSFMAAMLGVVVADDLISLFVFWELTSLTSYFLIGYEHERTSSRDGALQGLLITGSGGLAMLGGFLLIGRDVGTFRISEMLAEPAALTTSPIYLPALILVALGAFTKSAQFPFHVWLPNAMAAPTPVSAYLHSATMVKAGVYLLARLAPAMGGTAVWFGLLTGVGTATLLAAATLALLQRDAKRLLAYSTLIALGALVVLLGVGGTDGAKAMVVFMVAHALYKAPLFMVAGSIDHEAGSRDVTELRGLGRVMPVTWAVALLAGVSAAGLPPLLGFVAKEVAYETLLPHAWGLAALVAASAVMITIVVLVAWRPFAGRETTAPRSPHEAPPSMWLGPAVLAALGIGFGFAPDVLAQGLLVPATRAILGADASFHLALWHGVNTALILSIVTVAMGVLLTLAWGPLHRFLVARLGGVRFGPAGAYLGFLDGLRHLAAWQTRVLQSDDLQRHLTTIIGFAVALAAGTAFVRGGIAFDLPPVSGTLYEFLILILVVVAALATVTAQTRLRAITSLGVVGFGIALVFIMFSAPDLAVTQFLVETLMVIVVALVLMRLPSTLLRKPSERFVPAFAAPIAVLGGGLLTVLLLSVLSVPLDRTIPAFYDAASYPEAKGRNVVNVILVDFRALDTLGEITVLAVAATGAFALLRRIGAREARDVAYTAPRGSGDDDEAGDGERDA
ncbi:MAG: putative monovalent cation/H+ antiporter subunit A [Trueperaceae bacterium]|nr:putative monovalent cation/H+ antiporter subunit A [Trueperaceae bacterium]